MHVKLIYIAVAQLLFCSFKGTKKKQIYTEFSCSEVELLFCVRWTVVNMKYKHKPAVYLLMFL